MENDKTLIPLPPPAPKGKVSVEEAISKRRSVRRYLNTPLSLSQLSQLLWAAQGITGGGWLRAAPSAGATYPLEVFVITGRGGIEDLEKGIYRYHAERHGLILRKPGEYRSKLARAALSQNFITEAPASLVLCAVFSRTAECYGRRAERYVDMEVGHAAQNVHLECIALGLASVPVGAFQDDDVHEVLDAEANVRPLYIIPVGKAR